MNNQGPVPVSSCVTHLAFELWFLNEDGSTEAKQLPAAFMKSAQNMYLIESVGTNIIKITFKPKIQKLKGEAARQVFD